MKKLFETQEDLEAAISNFKMLKQTVGWQLLVEIVEGNIKLLEQQILEGFENETKEHIDRKRDKLKAYKEVISTPDDWIKRENTPIASTEEPDPYHTVESLKKSRGN